jgi:hypothetical protein
VTQPVETTLTRRRVDRLDAQPCTYENDPFDLAALSLSRLQAEAALDGPTSATAASHGTR